MPIISLDQLEKEPFHDGAFYQTMVGDDQGLAKFALVFKPLRQVFQLEITLILIGNMSRYWKERGWLGLMEKIKIKKQRSALEIQCLFLPMSCIDLGQLGSLL